MSMVACAAPAATTEKLAAAPEAPATATKSKVGISMPTQDLQRWNQDGANMKTQFKAAGYEVELQYANNDSMTMDMTRADMTQSVLKSVAFAIRDSFELAKSLGISIGASRICGGAKSVLWRKIISNVLNVPLGLLPFEKGPGYGATMLAAVACGEYVSAAEAAEALVRVSATELPNAHLAARDEERYPDIYAAIPGGKAAVSEAWGLVRGKDGRRPRIARPLLFVGPWRVRESACASLFAGALPLHPAKGPEALCKPDEWSNAEHRAL